jgi:hypothetical protein
MFVLLNHLFITSWYISNVIIYILLELFRPCGRVSFSCYFITFVVVYNFVASIQQCGRMSRNTLVANCIVEDISCLWCCIGHQGHRVSYRIFVL